MLENIKKGDLCVLKDGTRAFVIRVDPRDGGRGIVFDRKVRLFYSGNPIQNTLWFYDLNGYPMKVSGNNIIKVIPC